MIAHSFSKNSLFSRQMTEKSSLKKAILLVGEEGVHARINDIREKATQERK